MLTAAWTVTACGGGGEDALQVDLQRLVGTDTSVTVQPFERCFQVLYAEEQIAGQLVGRMVVEQLGPGRLLASFVSNSGQAGFSYDLRYVSGDNTSGYVFAGRATNTLTGQEFEVHHTSIRNSAIAGLAVTGTISVRNFGTFCGTTYSVR